MAVEVLVILERDYEARLAALAEQAGLSPSEAASLLIEQAIDDGLDRLLLEEGR